jgi:acetylglutamate kinase
MTYSEQQQSSILALRQAAPYIRLYRNKTFVIKAGGEVFSCAALTQAFLEQISILHYFGVRVVLVHGGGPQMSATATALGTPSQLVAGRRITDEHGIKVSSMVLNGLINTHILAICRELKIDAAGVSGVTAGLILAHKRPPVTVDTPNGGTTVDYGLVGDIVKVDGSILSRLLDQGLMPVVSPLSADEQGNLLNINADTVAAALSVALQAHKLILCTAVAGILQQVDDPRSLISYIDLPGLIQLRASGLLHDGMLPKAQAIESALQGGVARVHVVSSQIKDALLGEIFTNEGTGTLIVADSKTI